MTNATGQKFPYVGRFGFPLHVAKGEKASELTLVREQRT